MSSPHFHHIHGKWWKTTLVQALLPTLEHKRRQRSTYKQGKVFPACFYSLQCKLMGKNKFSTARQVTGKKNIAIRTKRRPGYGKTNFSSDFSLAFSLPWWWRAYDLHVKHIGGKYFTPFLSAYFICMNVWMFMLSHYSNTSIEMSWRQIGFEAVGGGLQWVAGKAGSCVKIKP